MVYESVRVVTSLVEPSVTFSVARMSFGRRMELMRKVRELARRMEFAQAGEGAGDKMDAALLRGEIDRLYLERGLLGVSGVELDGMEATPESFVEKGPEHLVREALAAVRAEAGLNEAERKN
ncbi:MAG: hypothetical protein LAQ30_06410 [Acidobacteriia bacterium]|nr:hypothetical protein [Terriglobia bacterium]